MASSSEVNIAHLSPAAAAALNTYGPSLEIGGAPWLTPWKRTCSLLRSESNKNTKMRG